MTMVEPVRGSVNNTPIDSQSIFNGEGLKVMYFFFYQTRVGL